MSIPILDKNNPDLRYQDIPDTPWVELKKESRAYYFNYDLKKAIWEEPPEYTLWKDSELDKFLRAHTDWTKRRRGGDVYYLNGRTKETSLSKPQVYTLTCFIFLCVYVCDERKECSMTILLVQYYLCRWCVIMKLI